MTIPFEEVENREESSLLTPQDRQLAQECLTLARYLNSTVEESAILGGLLFVGKKVEFLGLQVAFSADVVKGGR